MVYRYPFSHFGSGDLERPVRYNRSSWPADYYADENWPSFKEARQFYVPESYKRYFRGKVHYVGGYPSYLRYGVPIYGPFTHPLCYRSPYDFGWDKNWISLSETSDYYIPRSYTNYFYGRNYHMDAGSLHSYLAYLRSRGRLYGPMWYPYW